MINKPILIETIPHVFEAMRITPESIHDVRAWVASLGVPVAWNPEGLSITSGAHHIQDGTPVWPAENGDWVVLVSQTGTGPRGDLPTFQVVPDNIFWTRYRPRGS